MRFVTFLKVLLFTFGVGILAATYCIRTLRFYRSDRHIGADQTCEEKTEEQEAKGEAAVAPEEQRGCWSELDPRLNWEAIGQ